MTQALRIMEPIAVDERTLLRLVQKDDDAAIASTNDIQTADGARRWVCRALELCASGEEIPCTICIDGEPVGYVFLEIHTNAEGLLHYGIIPSSRGQGIATSACRRMVGHAFRNLGLKAVKIDIPVSNEPSCRLAERLGFPSTGSLTIPVEGEIARYRLTADQWVVQGGQA